MISKKSIKIAKVVGAVYVFYLLCTMSYLSPKSKHRTEFSSNKVQLMREKEQHANWREAGLNFKPNKKASLPVDSTVRQQLSYQFPYEPEKPMQKNIWQTWKVPRNHPDFPEDYAFFEETWSTRNDGWKHHLIEDEACESLIKHLFVGVPDVALAYFSMPKSILKADFFRYLILYARGGIYSDIDTINLKPVDTWIAFNETLSGKPNNPGLIIGIEADPDRPDWNEWYARRVQFCQWTMLAKLGHPMLRELIANITAITLTRKKNGKLKSVLGKNEGGDIMDWTGPGIWTDLIFNYLNNILQSPESFKTKKYEDIVNWQMFTGMKLPIVIDDVVVLPITCFSPDVNQMGAGNFDHPLAYSKHMFLGSWKDDNTHANVEENAKLSQDKAREKQDSPQPN